MPDVFLSYSRDDRRIMEPLRDYLRSRGLDVWTDEHLTPGTPSWEFAIEESLRGAGALIVLMSPRSNSATSYVRREISYAMTYGKAVFPVLVDGDEKSSVPFSLVGHQYVDIRGRAQKSIGEAYVRLAEAIGDALGLDLKDADAPIIDVHVAGDVHGDVQVAGRDVVRRPAAPPPAPRPRRVDAAAETLTSAAVVRPEPGRAQKERRPKRGRRISPGLIGGVVVVGGIVVVGIIVGLVALSGMLGSPATPTPEPQEEPTPAEEEAPPAAEEEPAPAAEEPEPVQYGTAENPIRFGFVPAELSDEILADADDIAALIEQESDLVVEHAASSSYSDLVDAMCNQEVEVGVLTTFAYMLASQQGCAEVAMVSVQFGSPSYKGQIIARADSGIGSWQDLAGAVFCRPDPTSTSGWIFPSIVMRANGIDPDTDLAQIIDSGGHGQVVADVYHGTCDAGATYGASGTFPDARVAVASEIPDAIQQVAVIAETPDIPNNAVAFAPHLDGDTRAAFTSALLAIAGDEANAELLNSVYNWDSLTEKDDSFFDPFRQQLEASGVDIAGLVD